MTEHELSRAAEQEADWVHYYGYRPDREADDVSFGFYDRIASIGYTKKVIPLSNRCAGTYVTSDKPVMDSSVDDLVSVSGPRNHEANVFTALEYVIQKRILNYQHCIDKIKS